MRVTRDLSLLGSTGKLDNISQSTLLGNYAVLKVVSNIIESMRGRRKAEQRMRLVLGAFLQATARRGSNRAKRDSDSRHLNLDSCTLA